MALHLEFDTCRVVLGRAFGEASTGQYVPRSSIHASIKTIVEGDHLTYRYILVTALVAKAVDRRVDCLALQAGASLAGAYDARSLCHKVLVPFERKFLANALGGSNEPFLNKPARYTQLAQSNAVRRGNDRVILTLLCKVLPTVDTTEKAFAALADALHFLITSASKVGVFVGVAESGVDGICRNEKLRILSLVDRLVSRSMEGEACSLAVTAALECLSRGPFKGSRVEVHPVNQAGSSSLEVSDVDVFFEGRLAASIEVKDKHFSKYDVGHAVSKVVAAGFDSLFFVKGPSGLLVGTTEEEIVYESKGRGVLLNFMTVIQFVSFVLGFVPQASYHQFCEVLFAQAKQGRVKQGTWRHLELICKER